MSQVSLSSVTFRQIEIFITVAKYENFTKAAEELYMSQAAVSRSIQSLELTLGIVLFVRYKRRAKLTNAGKSLAKEFAHIYQRSKKAIDVAFLQQQNEFSNLMIGDVNGTSMDFYLLPISKEFESRYSDGTLTIERVNTGMLLDKLWMEKYDAAFIINIYCPKVLPKGFRADLLFQVPPCIVIANTHPLFYKDDIKLEELQKYKLVAMRDDIYENYWDFTQKVCKETKIDMSNIKFVDNTFTLTMELKRNPYFAILDPLFAPVNREELRYIPIRECQTKSGIMLVSSENSSNPYLPKYISICKEMSSELMRFVYEQIRLSP